MSRSVNCKIIAALLGALVCNGNSGNKSLAMEADWMSNFFNDPLNGFNQGLFNSVNSVNEIKINNVKLNEKDQKWIKKNMIFIVDDKKPYLDWHNVSYQFLAGPEIRNNQINFDSTKIKHPINVINHLIETQQKNKININDYFEKKIRCNGINIARNMPDKYDNIIDQGLNCKRDFLFFTGHNDCYGRFNGIDFIEKITNINDSCEIYKLDNIKSKLSKIIDKNKGFTLAFYNLHLLNKFHPIKSQNDNSYYPTFVAMRDKNSNYSAFYVVYDKEKNIKFVLWADSNNLDVGFQALTFDEFIKVINERTCDICSNNNLNINNNNINNINNNNIIIDNNNHEHNYSQNAKLFIRFSPYSIVEKFYTPDNLV